MKKLEGKVALVTGASRGIGRATALSLAALGASVAVNYSSSEKEANDVVKLIRDKGGQAEAIKTTVSSSAEVNGMFSEIENVFGTVDILVNNAGITKDTLLLRMSDDDFSNVVDVNLKGAFYCMRAAIKGMMKKRYGKIINISSVVGFSGNPGQINYVASKSGLHGMTKTAAMEMGGRGIRVNSVAPGFIDTDMTSSLKEEVRSALIDQTLLKALGNANDVANAVCFLACPESDYITGQVIHVNGGLYL